MPSTNLLALVLLDILACCVKRTPTNAPPILAKTALLVWMQLMVSLALASLVSLVLSAKPTSMNVPPILAKTALLVSTLSIASPVSVSLGLAVLYVM
jgi:hypothetical protein